LAGIYLHIPFCKKACCYCNFHFSTSLKLKNQLLEALKKEIFLRKSEIKEPIETIYFGGGTPSLLAVDEINHLLEVIYNHFEVVQNAEITIECNPDDLSLEKIQALSITKINRLSIGIQSFFEDDLRFMNRAHTAVESRKCLEIATHFFKNITIDLIYGLPNMTDDKWKENLNIAFKSNVPHLSCYALTVEDKTALKKMISKGLVPKIDDEKSLSHFNILIEESEKNGFTQYEISNFAKNDLFSKHNTAYWQGKPYLGIGPSAHSYNQKERSWNISNNNLYIKSINQDKLPSEKEVLTEKEVYNEYVMTGLRTIWGISIDRIEKEFGTAKKELLLAQIKPYVQQESLTINPQNCIVTTSKGRFFADGMASAFFEV